MIYSLRRIANPKNKLFGSAGLANVDLAGLKKMDKLTVRMKLKTADSTIGEQLGPDVGDALSRALAEAGSLQTPGAQARPSGALIDQVAEKVEARVIETLRERVGKAIRERLRESLQRNPNGGFRNR